MKVELEIIFGYRKNQKGDIQTDSKRNGHSIKKLKSQDGESQLEVPRDCNSEMEPGAASSIIEIFLHIDHHFIILVSVFNHSD